MSAVLWFTNQTHRAAYRVSDKHVPGRATRRMAVAALAGLAMILTGSSLNAQGPARYYPLDQNTPPGVAGSWAGLAGKADGGYFQPVRVELPGAGQVTFYGSRGQEPVTFDVPGQVGMLVGHEYRFRISSIPRFPGAELYPSVELVDRLHPPRGRAADFPIPVTFSDAEIEMALNGKMITKVIYLEQPQFANPLKLDATVPVDVLRPYENIFAAADQLGRPMAIVRLGGRVPVPHGNNHELYGSGAPLGLSAPSGPQSTEAGPSGQ